MDFNGSGALGGAASGAAAGSAAGPWGAAAGGVIGGLLGGFGGGGAPKGPDYAALAQQQFQYQQALLKQQTQANRPDQNNPFFSRQWSQDANGNWTQNNQLSGDMQQLGASAMQRQQAGYDESRLPQLEGGEQARQQGTDAAYRLSAEQLDPQYAQRKEALRSQLYNQGATEGDPTWQREMGNFDREQRTSYGDARDRSQLTGSQMGNTVFQNSLAARGQGFGEQTAEINQPLQGFNSLLGAGNSMMGNVTPAGMGAPPDMLGAGAYAGQYGLGAAKIGDQRQAGWLGGLGSLGGAASGFFGQQPPGIDPNSMSAYGPYSPENGGYRFAPQG